MDPEIVAQSEAREIAARRLQRSVARLCKQLQDCEEAELLREEIARILLPLRDKLTTNLRPLRRYSFDLVLADGVFDSLSDAQAVQLLKTVYGFLAPGGKFVFMTLDGAHRQHTLFNHLSDVPLVARSQEKLFACLDDAGISRRNVTSRRQQRGRVLRIEVQKLE